MILKINEKINDNQNSNKNKLKPFIKWAGGKGGVLEEIHKRYPEEFGTKVNKFVEPFLGGGAVLFDILSNYQLKEIYISDSNFELINAYKVIQQNVEKLISLLKKIEDEYIHLDDEKRKIYYYEKRERFNKYILKEIKDDIEGAALFIFMNRTCFNGLYRVNKSGLYNVPMGSYKNPKICDEENLINISKKIKNITIKCENYFESLEFIDEKTFVYFDPPYRPLTKTSSFTSYTLNPFDDKEQVKLAKYFKKLDKIGAKVILSNSDPKNISKNDDFFDELFKGFAIDRIKVKRRINSKSGKRGDVTELLITNMLNKERNLFKSKNVIDI